MDTQQNLSQSETILLEVLSEDMGQLDIADIAEINEVSRNLLDGLQKAGYSVSVVHGSTRTKGSGSEPVVIAIVLQFLNDNKDWLLTEIPLLLGNLVSIRNKLASGKNTKHPPIKMTLEIDGKPLTVETDNVEDAEELVKRIIANQETKKDKKKKKRSTANIKVHIPRKK
jgi:hypothetical protein